MSICTRFYNLILHPWPAQMAGILLICEFTLLHPYSQAKGIGGGGRRGQRGSQKGRRPSVWATSFCSGQGELLGIEKRRRQEAVPLGLGDSRAGYYSECQTEREVLATSRHDSGPLRDLGEDCGGVRLRGEPDEGRERGSSLCEQMRFFGWEVDRPRR